MNDDKVVMILQIFTSLLIIAPCLSIWVGTRRDTTSQESNMAFGITKILKEVTSEGSFGNVGVTIMVEENAEEIVSLNELIRATDTPKIVLRMNGTNHSQEFHTEDSSFLKDRVLVGIVRSPTWWPLWSQEKWSPIAIFLLVLETPCHPKDFLITPLLERSTFVALLCPELRHKPIQKIIFEVTSWKPYASGNQILRLGSWNIVSFKTWDSLFVDRFSDFSRKQFDVSCSWTDEPVLYKREDGEVDGTSYRILTALSQWLKFEFNLNPHPNNSWVGMRDDVMDGVSDVMINYVTLTLERTQQFDVSIPYFSEGFGLVMKIPPPLPLWRNLYYPYTWKVWTAVGGTLMIVGLTYHLLNFNHEHSFFNNILTVAKCLISQPAYKISEIWRDRLFLSVWALLAWLLNLSYTCNLIAVLTVPVYPTKIQTAKELADSSKRVCMLDYGEFVPGALAIATEATLAALGRKLDLAPMRSDLVHWGQEGCIEKVLANTHSHLETNYFVQILYHDLNHSPQVYMLKDQLYVGNLAFLFKKHTPWKEKFNTGMRRLIEGGLVAKFYSDVLSKYTRKESQDGVSEANSLTVSHLQGAFMILLFGLALATLVFGLEVIFPKQRITRPS